MSPPYTLSATAVKTCGVVGSSILPHGSRSIHARSQPCRNVRTSASRSSSLPRASRSYWHDHQLGTLPEAGMRNYTCSHTGFALVNRPCILDLTGDSAFAMLGARDTMRRVPWRFSTNQVRTPTGLLKLARRYGCRIVFITVRGRLQVLQNQDGGR